MKKRLIALALMGTVTLSFVACGDKTETEETETTDSTEESSANVEYDVNDYVTLGEYTNLEVTITGDYDYTEEGYEEYVDEQISDLSLYVEDDSQTVVQEDSIVNVDYVGSQDGVAFDGGSAEDQNIDIANNSSAGSTTGYIDGFSEGLVGYSVGDEVAYEVTFPEDYGSADLAGQTVVFTFQINYIAKLVDADSITDDIAAEYFDCDTVDELMETFKSEYEQELADNKESDIQTAVQNAVENNATVSGVPQELLDAWTEIYINSVEAQYYATYGESVSLQELVEANGTDYSEYYAQIQEGLTESLSSILIFQAICEKEGLEGTEDDFYTYLDEIVEETGAPSREEFIAFYSLDNYDGENYFKLRYYAQNALDFCCESAVVTVEEATDSTEDTESTESVVE